MSCNILKSKDPRDLNAASMALWAIGIDAVICDQVDAVLEEGAPESARAQIVGALRRVKVSELDLDALIHDREVGVRVYAARIHWQKNRQANVVVPVLIEALNRARHQSYYYDAEILPAALTALGDIGTEAHEAAGALGTIARDPNPAIAKLASETLVKIRK